MDGMDGMDDSALNDAAEVEAAGAAHEPGVVPSPTDTVVGFVGAGPCACPVRRATTGGCPYSLGNLSSSDAAPRGASPETAGAAHEPGIVAFSERHRRCRIWV